MPAEFQASFKNELLARHEWIKKRISSEAKSITLILKKEVGHEEMDENYRIAKKKYPLADKGMLLEIRKKCSPTEEPMNEEDIFASVDRIKRSLSFKKISPSIVKPQRERFESIDKLSIKKSLSMIPENEKAKFMITSDVKKFEDAQKFIKFFNAPNGRSSPLKSPKMRSRRKILFNSATVEPLSMSTVQQNSMLIPVHSTRVRKLRIKLAPLSNSPDIRIVRNGGASEFMSANKNERQNKIIICRRNIEILEKKMTGREHTPNPFATKHNL